jgi:deoxycytidylate deaminase
MTEEIIFEHLLSIAHRSNDTDGVVTACLVRDDQIVIDAVSAGVEHAEYQLLRELKRRSIAIVPSDIVYVTVQPCDSRTQGSPGEILGDCTTNLIDAGVRNVVYGAEFTRSHTSNTRFERAGVSIRQAESIELVRKCIKLFNDTNDNPSKHLNVV